MERGRVQQLFLAMFRARLSRIGGAYTASNGYRPSSLVLYFNVVTTDLKEAFTALCRKMAEETDTKKLEILKQQMRLLLERESNSEEATDRSSRDR